jgi:hypothetical protein
MVRLLLAHGADVEPINEDEVGNTALQLAIIHDVPDVVKLLLQAGANPFAEDHCRHSTMDTVRSVDTFELLLAAWGDRFTADVLELACCYILPAGYNLFDNERDRNYVDLSARLIVEADKMGIIDTLMSDDNHAYLAAIKLAYALDCQTDDVLAHRQLVYGTLRDAQVLFIEVLVLGDDTSSI